ncbi:CLUMA_CG001908, isoform A [Clunio marinus]|uniref:CLUMA_CG001908, isoform A n=1 Tax=Clunio marinus TaxID=568069 RepID=A0A1J1HJN4_9DIPT|nr:CLUMA_CG001908, isoform A [Clunio marinus]
MKVKTFWVRDGENVCGVKFFPCQTQMSEGVDELFAMRWSQNFSNNLEKKLHSNESLGFPVSAIFYLATGLS